MDDAAAAGRRLVLVRHGKAEAYGQDDQSRPLTARGTTDARTLGEWLLEHGLVPDHAVVSSAVRTRETWSALSAAAGSSLDAQDEDGVYNAGPDAVIDVLRAVPADARTVLLLGHNPTVAWLANSLDDGSGDPGELMRVMDGFPPAACAVLTVPVPWRELGDGSCRVVSSWRP